MANGYHPRLETDPVWWNGSNINSFTTASSVGIRTVTLYGWDDRPDVRDVRESRPGQDGEYADNLYLGGRTITLEGEVYGSSWVDLQARKRALAAVVQPSSAEVLLKVPDPATASPTAVYASTGMTGYERVSARVVEAIQFGETLDPLCQAFQVVVRASDPRVYSDVETSTDSGTTGTADRTVTVDQTGTYATPETITVTGPTGSDWSVTEPTSGLNIPMTGLTLASAETTAINVRDRTVEVSGNYQGARTRLGSLVAGWMLNETSGTAADNYQGTATYDGTYTGGFTLNQSGPAAGIPSVLFNGSSGYVTVAYNAALNPSTVTCEFWFKTSNGTSAQQLFDSSSTMNGWSIRTNTGASNLRLTVNNGSGGATVNTATALPLNTFHHVVVVVSSGASSVYVNGVLEATTSAAFAANTTAATTLARATGSSGYLAGNLSRVNLYGRAFSATEAAALYSTAAILAPSIAGYSYLSASSARWANLSTASSTFTLSSSGLGSGSKLNLTMRDARI